jgi:hypothetical protein
MVRNNSIATLGLFLASPGECPVIHFTAERTEVLPSVVFQHGVGVTPFTVAIEIPIDTDLGTSFIEDRLPIVANMAFKFVSVQESLGI